MAFSGSQFFGGKPAGVEQVNRFNPQQQNTFQNLLGIGNQGLQNPYQGFEPIEQRARSQFQQRTIPQLLEQFTSMGGHGTAALSSPAFASQLGSAGAGLEEGLAAQRSQYGMQNQSQLMQLLGLGLTPQFNDYQREGRPGLFQSYAPGLGQYFGQAGLDYFNGGQGSDQQQGPGIGQQAGQQSGGDFKQILSGLLKLLLKGGLSATTGGASSALTSLL
jgi:hypothetical protein